MKQTLHIFAKDARHFLPEILVSLTITAAFAWIYPNEWLQSVGAVAGGSFFVPQELVVLAMFLTLLVPVSWWLLISRVVHAENLVGDCQFWITRPYEWSKLLAAKLLFLLCFLYLPIFLAQCLLLLQAGFHPLSYLPGLLYNLLLISAILVLPLLVLATVTSSFARMSLTILAIPVGYICIAALIGIFDHSSISNPLPDHLTLPLVLCGCATVIVLQYLTRRTRLSRVLLIVFVILVWTSTAVVSDSAVIRRAYPAANGMHPPALQLPSAPDSLDQPTTNPGRNAKWIGIRLPLRISGIGAGYAWSADNVKVSIEGPRNFAWSSPWLAMQNNHYLPDQQDFFVQFEIGRDIFDQVKSTLVTLRFTFAWTQLRSGQVQRIAIPTRDFVVAGFGICSPSVDWMHSQINAISCRYALRMPRLTYVDTRWSEDRCTAEGTPPSAGIEGSGWTGTLDTDPAEFSLAAVRTTPLPLSNNWNYDSNRQTKPRHLCPGTPLTLTEYSVVQRTQSDLTIPNFHFPIYSGDGGHR